jgi:hypothetical protein
LELDEIEKQVDKALMRYEIPDTFREWAIEHLNELNDMETNDRELVRKNAQNAYDDCVKQLDNLLKLKISTQNSDGSVISDTEYNGKRQYLISEKDALLEHINSTDTRINAWH